MSDCWAQIEAYRRPDDPCRVVLGYVTIDGRTVRWSIWWNVLGASRMLRLQARALESRLNEMPPTREHLRRLAGRLANEVRIGEIRPGALSTEDALCGRVERSVEWDRRDA